MLGATALYSSCFTVFVVGKLLCCKNKRKPKAKNHGTLTVGTVETIDLPIGLGDIEILLSESRNVRAVT